MHTTTTTHVIFFVIHKILAFIKEKIKETSIHVCFKLHRDHLGIRHMSVKELVFSYKPKHPGVMTVITTVSGNKKGNVSRKMNQVLGKRVIKNGFMEL